MPDKSPSLTVFVSYSWEGDEHQEWVTRLADRIHREPDLDVTFDQYDLFAGRDVTHFMERGLKCERIVVVSTPGYVRKASERIGGVGYECSLITADLARDMSQDRFIPVLREGDGVPAFLETKLRLDFRDARNYEVELSKLLAAIRRQAPVTRPPKRRVPTGSPPPIYTHELPPPVQLQPGMAAFQIEWGNAGVKIGVHNPGDYPVHRVRIRVEFDRVPAFELDFGDLPPDETKDVSIVEFAREHKFDLYPFVQHIKDVASGRGETNPQNRFLVLSEDQEGTERATAVLLAYDRKAKGLRLVNAPVVATFQSSRDTSPSTS